MIPTHYVTTTRGGAPVLQSRLVQIDFVQPKQTDEAAGAMTTAFLYDDDVLADYRHLDIVTLVTLEDGTPLSGAVEVSRYGVKMVHRQGGGVKQAIVELVGSFV